MRARSSCSAAFGSGAQPAGRRVGGASRTVCPSRLDSSRNTIYAEGKPEPKASEAPHAYTYDASPDYFRTMRTRLFEGRELEARDEGKTRVAIVNRAFVDQILGGGSGVGRRFRLRTGRTISDRRRGGRNRASTSRSAKSRNRPSGTRWTQGRESLGGTGGALPHARSATAATAATVGAGTGSVDSLLSIDHPDRPHADAALPGARRGLGAQARLER